MSNALVGHGHLRGLLEEHLPSVSLFLGPVRVGKTTMAEHLARRHDLAVHRIASPTCAVVGGLSELFEHPNRALMVLVDLTKASNACQTALKALLERLCPESVLRVVLMSPTAPDPRLSSVCTVFPFGYLSEKELRAIYLEKGESSSDAVMLAALSDGCVLDGGRINHEQAKQALAGLLHGIREADPQIISTALAGWDDMKQRLLELFLFENATREYRVFSDAVSRNILSPKLSMDILDGLHGTSISSVMTGTVLQSFVNRVRKGEYPMPERI